MADIDDGTTDENNFQVTIDTFTFVMDQGALTVNNATFELEGGEEIYALIRAYYHLRLGYLGRVHQKITS